MAIGIDTYYSRFNRTPPILFDGETTLGRWVKPGFLLRELDESDIVTITVSNSAAGKPHAIAEDVYGTTLLDWLVIAYNSPRSVLNWPRAGDVIRLPIRSVVMPELE